MAFILKVLLIVSTSVFLVYGDFHLNLYDREIKKYLSNIEIGFQSHYIEASKDKPDQFCRFNFVTTKLPEGKVLFQTNDGNHFQLTANNYIRPTEGSNLTSAEFDFIMESDPHRKQGARLALKATNGLYWAVVDKYVKAASSKPVYFGIYPID